MSGFLPGGCSGVAAAALTIAAASCTARPAPPPAVLTAKRLVVVDSVDHLDRLAREPMVVEHPDGTLFVTGYWEPTPTLWKSGNGGTSWQPVNVGTVADGAVGNSDVDLAVAADGTLYFITMVFDRAKLEGSSIQIGVSKDVGGTWRWTQLSKDRLVDRPWVEVAPNGTAHVIWNDGRGVAHVVSKDGGATWTDKGRVHDSGGSSHLAVGPNGEVAVRIVPLSASGNRFDAGVDLVAVSTDEGATWTKSAAPGERKWQPFKDTTVTPAKWTVAEEPRWVEPLAWDARGALYSLWGSGSRLWLARSADRGNTWASWQVAEGRGVFHYPYLVAQGQGELAAVWFEGPNDSLRAHVGWIAVGDGVAPPRTTEAAPFQPDSWALPLRGDDTMTRDAGGEYLGVAFLQRGGFAVVAPIQNMAAKRMGFSWRRYQLIE